MKNNIMRNRLIIGAVMMLTIAGSGIALAEKTTSGTSAVPVSAEGKDQESKMTEQEHGEDNKNSLLYGKVYKITKNKLILDSASLVWEMNDKNEQKAAAENEQKEVSPKNDKTDKAAENNDIAADLETSTMKWKLEGKRISVKIDENTKYVMEASAEDDKPEKKDETKSSSEDAAVEQNKVMKMEDLKEGMLLKVTLKEDNSMTALEVMVVANVKETNPVEVTDKNMKAGQNDPTETEKGTTDNQTL